MGPGDLIADLKQMAEKDDDDLPFFFSPLAPPRVSVATSFSLLNFIEASVCFLTKTYLAAVATVFIFFRCTEVKSRLPTFISSSFVRGTWR